MERPRFLFDECVGKPHMEALRRDLQTECEFVHITDYFAEGAKDREWIPRLAAESGWIVMTADRGTHSRAGEKLPEICRVNQLTHVVLSKTIHAFKSFEKIRAIRHVWSDILQLHTYPPGSRFLLRIKMNKGKREPAIVLEHVEVKPKRLRAPRSKRKTKKKM